MSAMKDWKTYAIIVLALWCAFLTCAKRNQPATLAETPSDRTESTGRADFTDSPPVFDTNGSTASWTAGGSAGLALDCYCKVGPLNTNSAYSALQRCRVGIGANGRIESAELLPDRIRLTAASGKMPKPPHLPPRIPPHLQRKK